MFDLPHADMQAYAFDVDVPPMLDDWQIGVIVGPSGAGKTTVARAAYPLDLVTHDDASWTHPCILDDFPSDLDVETITGALISVGLSSVPAWMLPYNKLSTGQQFRAQLARALLESDQVVYDEFTSVVDRTVAKACSVSVAKHVRRDADRRFVAVTCHYDILEWLEPDWVLDMADGSLERRRLRRPSIELVITEGERSAWTRFRHHHYLTGDLSPSARVFLAYVTLDGVSALAGFFSILPTMGMKGWWRGHRTVVLPDYQGMGIGNAMIEHVADALWTRERKRFRATTAAPGIVHHRRKHPEMWRLVDAPRMKAPSGNRKMHVKTSAGRLTTTWEYLPTSLRPTRGDASSNI